VQLRDGVLGPEGGQPGRVDVSRADQIGAGQGTQRGGVLARDVPGPGDRDSENFRPPG